MKLSSEFLNSLTPREFVNFWNFKAPGTDSLKLWHDRLGKDFPYVCKFDGRFENQTSKEVYLMIFNRYDKLAWSLTKTVLDAYGKPMKKYLTLEFEKLLYNTFYNLIDKAMRRILEGDYEDKVWIFDEVSGVYFNEYAEFEDYLPGVKEEYENFGEVWQDAISTPLEEFVVDMIKFLKGDL